MNIIYSYHASQRMKQRGITEFHVEHVLKYPSYVKKSLEGKKEAVGTVEGRNIKIIFIEIEKYIKIVSIM